MTTAQVTIEAADGRCTAYVSRPDAGGAFPGVLLYVDAMGVRPAMREIADRIPDAGYHVLLPDIFFRAPGRVPDPNAFFSDPSVRAAWQKDVVPTVTAANIMRDTESFLAYFAGH